MIGNRENEISQPWNARYPMTLAWRCYRIIGIGSKHDCGAALGCLWRRHAWQDGVCCSTPSPPYTKERREVYNLAKSRWIDSWHWPLVDSTSSLSLNRKNPRQEFDVWIIGPFNASIEWKAKAGISRKFLFFSHAFTQFPLRFRPKGNLHLR